LKFKGKILVFGCGGVSQCTIPLLLKLTGVAPKNVTILDHVDNRNKVKSSLAKGVKYVINTVTKDSYRKIIKKYLKAGDVCVDLAYDIDTAEIINFCHDYGVLYINTSVELWTPYHGADKKHPTELTLYARQMAIRQMIAKWPNKKGPTSVVDHGANPGLVSHFTKQALTEICEKILKEKPRDPRRAAIEVALHSHNFAAMAHLSGVKTIHISERDTQLTGKPKEVNEFVNTWSIIGFIEEAVAPAELGWGTHERWIPKGAMFHKSGPKNQICLVSKGMDTWARSWVPCGEIIGMVVRHGEAFSISDTLTVWDGDTAVYRPTVHYVYHPSDSAFASIHELAMRRYVPQERFRVLQNDIVSGNDELGCLLMGHDFKSWWIGSLLDIKEARKLVPGQNATTLQVAISVVAAVIWMINHPNEGFNTPDDLDHEEILKIARPFLGPFVSKPVNWSPISNKNLFLEDYGTEPPKKEDEWQFMTFCVSHKEKQLMPYAVNGTKEPRAAH